MEIEEICKKYRAGLKEKIRLLDRFKQATAKTKAAIEAEDTRQIHLHLKERQGIIYKIERIDKGVDDLVQANGFSIEMLSGKARELLGGYFDQIKTFLESISAVDNECLDLARAEHNRLKSEILRVRRGYRVTRGYRPKRHQIPRFLDLKR